MTEQQQQQPASTGDAPAELPKVRNVSTEGKRDVPLIRRVVDALEEVEVRVEHASTLLRQRANFEPANAAAQAIADELDAEQHEDEQPETAANPKGQQFAVGEQAAEQATVPDAVVSESGGPSRQAAREQEAAIATKQAAAAAPAEQPADPPAEQQTEGPQA